MEVSILEIITDGVLQDVTVFVLPLPAIVVINFSEKRHTRQAVSENHFHLHTTLLSNSYSASRDYRVTRASIVFSSTFLQLVEAVLSSPLSSGS